jgi:hypothetical protein
MNQTFSFASLEFKNNIMNTNKDKWIEENSDYWVHRDSKWVVRDFLTDNETEDGWVILDNNKMKDNHQQDSSLGKSPISQQNDKSTYPAVQIMTNSEDPLNSMFQKR